MDPTPYWEAVSTSVAPPCSTTFEGPRTKSWWNCATSIRSAWTRPPVVSEESKITRSGTASTIRAITTASMARPSLLESLGSAPGRRRPYATETTTAISTPNTSTAGLIDSTTVNASSAQSRMIPVTATHSDAARAPGPSEGPTAPAAAPATGRSPRRATRSRPPPASRPDPLPESDVQRRSPPRAWPPAARPAGTIRDRSGRRRSNRPGAAPGAGPAGVSGRSSTGRERSPAFCFCSTLSGAGEGVGSTRSTTGAMTTTKQAMTKVTVRASVGPSAAVRLGWGRARGAAWGGEVAPPLVCRDRHRRVRRS